MSLDRADLSVCRSWTLRKRKSRRGIGENLRSVLWKRYAPRHVYFKMINIKMLNRGHRIVLCLWSGNTITDMDMAKYTQIRECIGNLRPNKWEEITWSRLGRARQNRESNSASRKAAFCANSGQRNALHTFLHHNLGKIKHNSGALECLWCQVLMLLMCNEI